MPIRLRMTLWYALLLTLVVAAVGVFVVVRLRSDLVASIDRNLAPAAQQIATGYQQEGGPEFRDSSASLLAGERAASQVLSGDGRVLMSWGDRAGARPLLSATPTTAALRRPLAPHTRTLADGVRFRVASQPVTVFGHHEAVVTAVSTAPVDHAVARVTRSLLLALPAALLLAAAGGWWLARRALRPIDEMTTAAAAMDADRLGERLSHPGARDEVGHLATTLNAMLDRLEHGVTEQRRLVADASHELRTPLAAMRSELDVSLRLDELPAPAREVLESARDEVDALARTVDDLLTLATVDAGEMTFSLEPVDLQELANQVASSMGALALTNDVTVVVDGEPARVRADRAALRHVVRNLIENAIEFSPAGARVEITSEALAHAARLSVVDGGPGVPPAARERIFARFYRADPARSRRTGGSGLGLAIARELVDAQGGRLWVEDRQPNGAAFRLEFTTP
jgi:heavy metal sensor kinase